MRSLPRSASPFVSSPLDVLGRWLDAYFTVCGPDSAALRERLVHFVRSAGLRRSLELLLAAPSALLALASRSYRHGNGFFKFELLARNGYKVRLHVWLPGTVAEENIHDHRWSFTSVILAGSLTSESFQDDPEGQLLCTEYAYTARGGGRSARKARVGQARLRSLGRTTRRAGEVYSMGPEALHRICAGNRELIATLMVSEPPRLGGSRLLVEQGRDVDPDVAALPLDPLIARSTLLRALEHMSTEETR